MPLFYLITADFLKHSIRISQSYSRSLVGVMRTYGKSIFERIYNL